MSDIAALAGVSLATADRVLNERGSVSPDKRAKVIAAARTLGTPRVLPDPRHGLVRLDVLLPPSPTPFFLRLRQAMQRATALLDRRVLVHRQVMADDEEATLLRALLWPPYRRAGVILTAPDTPAIRTAVQTVRERGEAVVTLVTRLGGIEGLPHAGIDHLRAGRTAGYFLGRWSSCPGQVLLLTSRQDYRGHMERIQGCQAVLRERFPALHFDERPAETHDDPDRCFLAVQAALAAASLQRPLVGLYNTGAGSAGIEAALRRHDALRQVCWVTHEISDDHREYLRQGVLDLAIDQDPDGQALRALQLLLHACGAVEGPPPRQGPHEFRLYCAENFSEEPYAT